ncbi:collagen alpha-2(VIII) chain-like [Mya arenaria]|uniref:collagen alpha-2(VIII) chain-like n=1 Tax=Mya arenaria TaxID=6604 RepID=UPI0022E12E7E|nr:collagen alpha-2(VIII) chain-like [Mya arenaria]
MGLAILLLTASVCLTASLPVEPQSWLSLVEQLLKKMVRMELNVEAMHKEMQQARDQVTSGLREVDNMKQTVGALQTYFTDNINKSDTVIAFNAHTIVNTSSTHGQVIVFSNPLYNIGSAYDSGAGIFTAPFTGVYLFSAHFCIGSANSWYYAFVVDSKQKIKGLHYNANTDCSTATTTVVLKHNERLWIECTVSNTNDIFLNDNKTYYRNTFSGALLHRVENYP